jgi:protein-tyrosine phosphatase
LEKVFFLCQTSAMIPRTNFFQAHSGVLALKMIDLHSHMLSSLDDGAEDIGVSLGMARAYARQGVTHVACTPHILPGIYENRGADIRQAVAGLQARLDDAGIPVTLVTGADNHIVPDFVERLKDGHLLTIADSPYVLVEPPHNIVPPRLEDLFFGVLLAGYVPILTHPERLSWIETKYEVIRRLAGRGVWMQITAGSLRGAFGRRARYWAERMTAEGLVHVLATDAHNMTARRPDLAEGYAAAEALIGGAEAQHMVLTRPQAVLSARSARDLLAPEAGIAVEFTEP